MEPKYSCKCTIIDAVRASGKALTRSQVSAYVMDNYDTTALGPEYANPAHCRRKINAALKHAVNLGSMSFDNGLYQVVDRKPKVCIL